MTLAADRLFELLRNALWRESLREEFFKSLSEKEWSELYKLSSRQGVLALAYDAWMSLPPQAQPPRTLKIAWACNAEQIERSCERQLTSARAFFTLCRENGLKPILLKGIALSRCYPRPEHRPCGDIDIFLGADSMRCDELMRRQGIEVESSNNEKHSEFLFDSTMIENHRTFVDTTQFTIDFKLECYLENAAVDACTDVFEGLEYRVLPPTADALFLLRHTARHLESGIGLRHVCDWALFVYANSAKVDWSEFDRVVCELRLETFAAILNGIACDSLGLDSALLPPFERHTALQARVLEHILAYEPEGRRHRNPVKAYWSKYRRMLRRRWIFNEVLHTSLSCYIWKSAISHAKRPQTIISSGK